MRSFLFEIVETILLALAVFLIVRTGIQTVRVDGLSMDPTLTHGQYLIVNKLVYLNFPFSSGEETNNLENRRIPFFKSPSAGDLIVFHLDNEPERDLIKRVIGVPGDSVAIVNGFVYVNDRLLQEPYVANRDSGFVPPEIVQSDHYFVLGDNRKSSADSRFLGQISHDNIVGKAWLAFWPFSNFGTLGTGNGILK